MFRYTVSSIPYVWTTLMKDLEGVYHPVCRPKGDNKSEFNVKVRNRSWSLI